MRNNKGFFTIEAIAAFSVFLTILLTLMPIVIQLKIEQETMSQRRFAQSQLQGQLLEYVTSKDSTREYDSIKIKEQPTIRFKFSEESGLVKGCAMWKNAKSNPETFCLYGKHR